MNLRHQTIGGAGLPDAKPKEGYDLAVIDFVVNRKGNRSGTLAPAASVTLNQGTFVVQDYASEPLRLPAVRKPK